MSEQFELFCKQHAIPATIMVNDAAFILGVKPAEVRRRCQEGELQATEVIVGSGKWRIDVAQLQNESNWSAYVEKRDVILQQSKNIVQFMVKELDALNE